MNQTFEHESEKFSVRINVMNLFEVKKQDFIKSTLVIENKLKSKLSVQAKFVFREGVEIMIKNHLSNEVNVEIPPRDSKLIEFLFKAKKLSFDPLLIKFAAKSEHFPSEEAMDFFVPIGVNWFFRQNLLEDLNNPVQFKLTSEIDVSQFEEHIQDLNAFISLNRRTLFSFQNQFTFEIHSQVNEEKFLEIIFLLPYEYSFYGNVLLGVYRSYLKMVCS